MIVSKLKQQKTGNATSLMASTLMQKIMLYNDKINSKQQNESSQNNSLLNKLKIKTNEVFNSDHIQELKINSDTPSAKLNIQYQMIKPSYDRTANFSNALKKNKNKPSKQCTLLPSIRNQTDNIIQCAKTDQIVLSQNRQYQRLVPSEKANTQVFSQQTITKVQTIQKQKDDQKQKNNNSSKSKYLNDKSPKKLMMHFQLFFPKSKIKSSIKSNQISIKTKRSINCTALQSASDIFKVKNSSKSMQINEKQKQRIELQKEIMEKQLIQKETQTQKFKIANQKDQNQDQVLMTLGKNSAQKYIQKIQKYKKYKISKQNKQSKFGLNVLPAEYHQFKLMNQTKKFNYRMFFKQNNFDNHNDNQSQLLEATIFKQNSKKNKFDQSPSNLLFSQPRCIDNLNNNMNATFSQGMSLSLHDVTQYNNQQQQQCKKQNSLVKKVKSKQSPQKKSSLQNELLLKKKNIFGANQMQRKKNLFKTKYYDFNGVEKGSHKIKLMNMLNSLDQLLNSYCCRISSYKQSSSNQNKLNLAKKMMIPIQKQVQNSFIEIGKTKQTRHIDTDKTVEKNSNQQLSIQLLNKNNINILRIPNNFTITTLNNITLNKKQKYLFFVGNGNNKNLIRSVMKKRCWWLETDNIKQAHFVWTQLKIKQILEKEEKSADRKIEEPDSWHFKQRSQNKVDTIVQNSKNYKNKINIQLELLQSYEKQLYSKFFHQSMKPIFYNKITQKQKQYQFLRQIPSPQVIHNHYDANYMIGNKKALFYNLVQYENYKKINAYDFIPMTFHVEKPQSKQFRSFMKAAKKFKNALWIVKPGQNSNRGNGIIVENNADKIKTYVETNSHKHSFIIQKYLKNIFLYNRRKFDIRVYMLMVTIGGITKFFWYQEGYIRTSSQIYNPTDISDIFIHLTNDAIQSKNQTYSKYEKGNKVSYSQFQRYLDSSYPNEKYNVQGLAQQMKNIATTVVKSTYFKLDKAKKANGFQLFGLDFLIDKNFKPWLLQVNTNPCLQLSSPVLQRLIPRMIQNMFRIAIDPIFRPNQNLSKHVSYFLYDNVFQTNKFNLIFDSLFDSDFEWEQICNKQKNLTYQDDDEVFQNNGDELEIGD